MLKSILKLGTMYTMDPVREWAEYFLEKSELDPCERLQLARDFNIPAWIQGAFTTLVHQDPNDMTWAKAQALGARTYYILTKTREALLQERMNFCLYPPKFTATQSPECYNHGVCHSSWRTGWWNVVSKRYLLCSPHPPPLKDTMTFIKSLSSDDMTGVHPDCFTEAVRRLVEGVDRFGDVEMGIISDAVTEITRYNDTQILYYRAKP